MRHGERGHLHRHTGRVHVRVQAGVYACERRLRGCQRVRNGQRRVPRECFVYEHGGVAELRVQAGLEWRRRELRVHRRERRLAVRAGGPKLRGAHGDGQLRNSPLARKLRVLRKQRDLRHRRRERRVRLQRWLRRQWHDMRC